MISSVMGIMRKMTASPRERGRAGEALVGVDSSAATFERDFPPISGQSLGPSFGASRGPSSGPSSGTSGVNVAHVSERGGGSQNLGVLTQADGQSKIEKTEEEDNTLVVHGVEGVYSLAKSKWPQLQVPKEESEKVGVILAEDVIGEGFGQQEWKKTSDKKSGKGKQQNYLGAPVMAVRASTRVPRDGVSTLDKAMYKAQVKNLQIQLWMKLLKQREEEQIESTRSKMLQWLRGFQPSSIVLGDVGEI